MRPSRLISYGDAGTSLKDTLEAFSAVQAIDGPPGPFGDRFGHSSLMPIRNLSRNDDVTALNRRWHKASCIA